MKIENMFNNEKGTSPVIGVMLMVVVTVILAAAVSSYSSGMIDTTESAPVATFDVKCVKDIDDSMSGTTLSYLQIKQVTGESMPTADLKIMTTDANGVVTEILPNNGATAYNNGYSDVTGSAPYLNNPGIGFEGNALTDFGNYTLKTGSVMDASQYGTDVGTTSLDVMFSDWANVSDGDFVNVKIVHTPSQKVIFQTDTEVI
ncbi:type IV pilin N-terminal domain-containing protein [Methanococcoides methylutens]|uniref:Archaeal Type IV pilin N-terminal domain-containing protein n=1 Tax=Methanococcoides methylutens MM1 TaxID=1434104 RepID=A0A0E3STE0_METMT|nr:type IV pilin N-terminal domain-containing protein [Methanococcoides methylutens]AKB85872.1 hypothetical protein MCMEM_1819 [Methanococcoides methylutens MM1]